MRHSTSSCDDESVALTTADVCMPCFFPTGLRKGAFSRSCDSQIHRVTLGMMLAVKLDHTKVGNAPFDHNLKPKITRCAVHPACYWQLLFSGKASIHFVLCVAHSHGSRTRASPQPHCHNTRTESTATCMRSACISSKTTQDYQIALPVLSIAEDHTSSLHFHAFMRDEKAKVFPTAPDPRRGCGLRQHDCSGDLPGGRRTLLLFILQD